MLKNRKGDNKVTELDRAFETILEWKARKLLGADYREKVVADSDEMSFKLGAVDAMIYDMASLVGLTKQNDEHSCWTARAVRKQFLTRVAGGSHRSQPAVESEVESEVEPEVAQSAENN
jgi:hypothetical protein